MKHILLPTDFSEANDYVLAYAVNLAKTTGAELSVLYVKHPYQDPEILTSMGAVPSKPIIRPEVVLNKIHYIKDILQKDKALRFDIQIVEGLLQDEIHKLAKQKNIDLIVMGNENTHNKLIIWYESNASDMIRKRKYPVLVVPKKYEKFASDGMEVIFSTDFEDINDWDVLDVFRDLALKLKAKITLFSVKDSDSGKEWTLNEKDLYARYQEYFKGLALEVHHSYKKEIVSAVEDFAKHKKAGLIVMVSHDMELLDRIFHKSITREMAIYSEIPFLAIPDAHLEENTVGVTNDWTNL